MRIGREIALATVLFVVLPVATIAGGYALQEWLDATRPAPPPFDPEGGDAGVYAGGRPVDGIVAGYLLAVLEVMVLGPLVYLFRLTWRLTRRLWKADPGT